MATKQKQVKRKKSQRCKESPPIKNIHYVQWDNKSTKKHKLEDVWERKYTTFFKIHLPPVDDVDSTQEKNNQAEDFNNAMSILDCRRKSVYPAVATIFNRKTPQI